MPEERGKKLKIFTDSVLSESTAEAQRIIDELRRSRDEAVGKADAEFSEEAERWYKAKSAEVSAREARRVSARMMENKHSLLKYREECAVAVFNEARRRIEELTKSEEYASHMTGLLRRAVAQLGYGFSAEVFLRPEDMHLTGALLASVSGVSLAFSEGTFLLGGLRLVCPSRGLRVDLSFDSALSDLVGHFSELSGMQME